MNRSDSDFESLVKLIIIGDAGVGKSNYLYRFAEGQFCPVYEATVGFDYKSKTSFLPNCKKKVKFQIWDTAGQEKYMSINKNLFQRVQGIILMYDITEMKSFQNLSVWMNAVEQLSKGTPLILIGNKIDLKDKRQVSSEQGKEYADKYNIEFFESSGKSGENVEKSFIFLGEEIMRKSNVEEKTGGNDYIISKDSTFNKKKKNKKCC
jgi:small GTP-binding protein